MAAPLINDARYLTYVQAAEDFSGLDIRRLSLEGPITELTATAAAQPAIMAVSLALADRARAEGIQPSFVAGHSLGEYAAAVAAGSLNWEDGLRAVCERGRLMAAEQSSRPGTMAAIMGLEPELVAGLCHQSAGEGLVVIANINGAGQVVISGDVPAVTRAVELASHAGAAQASLLAVGAAFHSPLMEPVQVAMGRLLAEVQFADPRIRMVANFSGEVVGTGEDVRDALVRQITSPVLWRDTVRRLSALGADTFLELGPGRVLTGLVHVELPDVGAHATGDPEKLARWRPAAAFNEA